MRAGKEKIQVRGASGNEERNCLTREIRSHEENLPLIQESPHSGQHHVIPHGNPKPLNIKIPAVGILISLLLLGAGAVQIYGV